MLTYNQSRAIGSWIKRNIQCIVAMAWVLLLYLTDAVWWFFAINLIGLVLICYWKLGGQKD